jgi:glycolate oxidase FAD binding subunit
VRTEEPGSPKVAADLLAACSGEGRSVRFRGGGTKLGWGAVDGEPDVELVATRLDRILEHNAGDLTAVLEAGAPLAAVQEAFATAGQMLALDPPLAQSMDGAPDATIGGVLAAGDTGPLRHRYGASRDLVVGMTVALSDGTVARSGGKVIKNVAGYDLAKLLTGSFGTLGLIVEVVVRLHPLPKRRVTTVGESGHASAIQRAALVVGHAPLELESLDASWSDGTGRLLARSAGAAPEPRAQDAARLMRDAGLRTSVVEDDDPLWAEQRAGQRSSEGLAVRVSALPADLALVFETAANGEGWSVVGRAGLGVFWVTAPPDRGDLVGAVDDLRRALAPRACAVLDAPPGLGPGLDVWGPTDPGAAALMRRIKDRFDPTGTCSPGRFVGGI